MGKRDKEIKFKKGGMSEGRSSREGVISRKL